jgi:pimeloyl-ACP methyl ester carboxylesterase
MNRIDFDNARRFADTSFGKVAYMEEGDGPAALFCHGALLNGYQWREVLDRCAEHRRVIAPDHLGHGHTTTLRDAPIDFAAQAGMLVELLDALGVDRVDLVGNDSGGAIVQTLAVGHPARVRSMALANCDARDSLPPPGVLALIDLARAGVIGQALAGLLADIDSARAPEALGGVFEHPENLTEETIDAYLGPVVADESTAHALERFLITLADDQLAPLEQGLRELDVPTLIAWGTADSTFPLDRAQWLADTLPGARPVVEVEGAKLFWPEERPELLAGLLVEHWQAAA